MKLNTISAALPPALFAAGAMSVMLACASVPSTPAPVPVNVPRPAPPQPTPVSPVASVRIVPTPGTGSWNFSYTPGTYMYDITTDALIASLADTSQKRQIPELHQKTTISIASSGDVQVLDPVAVSATACDSSSALLARAQQLIPKIPARLDAGARWRDSTTTSGCRGSIPAESTVIGNYLVIGDTAMASGVSMHAVQIHRADSLSASGEGADGQHRIIIAAKGTGDIDLYFDVTSGRLIGSRGVQNSVVSVTTSGTTRQFAQHVTENVALAGVR